MSDDRWNSVCAPLPSNADRSRLRVQVEQCCNKFLADAREIEVGSATLDAIRRLGGKQASLIDKLIKQLLAVEKTLHDIGEISDDTLGEFGNWIKGGRVDVERRKQIFIQAAREPANLRGELIRQLAVVCRAAGLRPTASGHSYDTPGKPSWFQIFVQTVNDQLLGAHGWGSPGKYSTKAMYSEVAKALMNRKIPTAK